MICVAGWLFTREACNTACGNQAKECRALLASKRRWQSECAFTLPAHDCFSKSERQLGGGTDRPPSLLATYLGPTPLNTTACTFATVCSKNAGFASVCPVSASTCTAKSA